MDFKEFRRQLEREYRALNKGADVRIRIPSDEEMLHTLLAIDTYFQTIGQEMVDEYGDIRMGNDDDDFDWDDFLR